MVTNSSHRSSQKSIPKIKASCTPCSSGKVRCDKQKPTCGRCSKTGRSCQYAQSRRCGRPPTAKPSTQAKVFCADHGVVQCQQFASPIQTRPPESSSKELAPEPDLAMDMNEILQTTGRPSFEASWSTKELSLPEPCGPDLELTESTPILEAAEVTSTINVARCPLHGTHSMTPASSYLQTLSPCGTFSPLMSTSPFSTPGYAGSYMAETHTPFSTTPRDPVQLHGCDCIAKLLTTFAAASPSRSDDLSQMDGFHYAMGICRQVLACSCLVYDERVTSLISFVVLSQLAQTEDEGNSGTIYNSDNELRSVARTLANQLRTGQPGLARATADVFAQFWFATCGSARSIN